MSSESTRAKIIDMVRHMRDNTVDRGCTPGEAAKFAAKVAELVEKHQISEAELQRERNRSGGVSDEREVYHNILHTGKKAHNPGMTAVVTSLARGMCCECILLPAGWHDSADATYGIMGDEMDADYVCQIATYVVPALQVMASLEGREHGHGRYDLVKWTNQYLAGAAHEIRNRLEKDRASRSATRRIEWQRDNPDKPCTSLMVVTGESLAVIKRDAAAAALKEMYPVTLRVTDRSTYDPEAQARGREAGKSVGLNVNQLD